MLKKTLKRKWKQTLAVMLLLGIVLASFSVTAWEWENGNHYLAGYPGRNYHQHCTIRLANGSILVSHFNGTTHANGNKVSSHFSHDNGKTWIGGPDIWSVTDGLGAVNSGLGVASNGTVICLLQMREADGTPYYGMRITRSYDNGQTWTPATLFTPNDPYATMHISSQIVTKGSTMYAPVYNGTSTPLRFSVYVSSDNGSTWSKRSEVYNGAMGNSYSTLVPMSDDLNDGSFLWITHVNSPNSNYIRISHDNCTTWGSLTQILPGIRDPDVNRMGDNYFLHGRDSDHDDAFRFYYSPDGVSWIETIQVDVGGNHEAYSSGTAVGHDLLLTYSKNADMCHLQYTWIYNVSTIPPNKPNITGPTNGKTDSNYTYITSTTDADGDLVYYMWNWGDDSSTDWVGPYESGEVCTRSHMWAEKGSYEIKVKAKDNYGGEGKWSDPLTIFLTELSLEIKNRFVFITTMIKNTGDYELTNINWSLTVLNEGGILLIPTGVKEGILSSLTPGGVKRVITPIVGFGGIGISLTAFDEMEAIHGFVIGPFIFLK